MGDTKKPNPDKSSTSKVGDSKQKPISDRDAEMVKGGATQKKK